MLILLMEEAPANRLSNLPNTTHYIAEPGFSPRRPGCTAEALISSI